MEQVQLLGVHTHHGYGRVVVLDACLSGRVARKNDGVEFAPRRDGSIPSKPTGLDHIAVRRRWILLVLRAEYAATDFALGIVESLRIIPIGLKQFSGRSAISLGFPERIVLGLVRNRWN